MTPAVDGRPRRTVLAVRTVFLLVALSLPAELLVARFAGEPYPALFQPSFAGAPYAHGVLTQDEPAVLTTFTDGSQQATDYRTLLPTSGLDPLTVFTATFDDDRTANRAPTRRWLRDRLARCYPGRDVAALTITWERRMIVVADPSRSTVLVLRRIRIDLASP